MLTRRPSVKILGVAVVLALASDPLAAATEVNVGELFGKIGDQPGAVRLAAQPYLGFERFAGGDN